MKIITVLCFSVVMMLSSLSCNSQSSKVVEEPNSSSKVEAYYFHFSGRCVTCKAVESEAKADIESLYAGAVSFESVNLDEDSSKALAERLKVSGQTLLLVKGDKKINITNEGFMYARSNPEKFNAIIKQKIDQLLKL